MSDRQMDDATSAEREKSFAITINTTADFKRIATEGNPIQPELVRKPRTAYVGIDCAQSAEPAVQVGGDGDSSTEKPAEPCKTASPGAYLVLSHSYPNYGLSPGDTPRRWQGPNRLHDSVLSVALIILSVFTRAQGEPVVAHGSRENILDNVTFSDLGYDSGSTSDIDWGRIFELPRFDKPGLYYFAAERENTRHPYRRSQFLRGLTADCTALTHNRLYEQRKTNGK